MLGNHDYAVAGDGEEVNAALADRVAAALEAVGVHVLRNESVPLRRPTAGEAAAVQDAADDGDLHLVGIGPAWPERARVEEALGGVPATAARIVMMHNPNTYPRLPAGAPPLAVTGPTHGGQFRLPFLPEWSWRAPLRPAM